MCCPLVYSSILATEKIFKNRKTVCINNYSIFFSTVGTHHILTVSDLTYAIKLDFIIEAKI